MAREINIHSSVTSRLDIQFKTPLVTKEIIVYAKKKQTRKNLIDSDAWIFNENGKVAAKAFGILFTR